MPLAAALSPLARTRRIDQRTRGASNMDVLESGEARDSIDTTAFPLRVKMANGRSSSTIAIIYRLKMTVKQIRVVTRGEVKPPTLRFSGVGITARQRPLAFAACVFAPV